MGAGDDREISGERSASSDLVSDAAGDGGGGVTVFFQGQQDPYDALDAPTPVTGALWVMQQHSQDSDITRQSPRVFSVEMGGWQPADPVPATWISGSGLNPPDATALFQEVDEFTVTGDPDSGNYTIDFQFVGFGASPKNIVSNDDLASLQAKFDATYGAGATEVYQLDSNPGDLWLGWGVQWASTDAMEAPVLSATGFNGGTDPDVTIVRQQIGGENVVGLDLPLGSLILHQFNLGEPGQAWLKVASDNIDGWELVDHTPPAP